MRKFRGAGFKRNVVELEAADPEAIPLPDSSPKLRSRVAPFKAGTPGSIAAVRPGSG